MSYTTYLITNTTTGCVYVGRTKCTIDVRWTRAHRPYLRGGYHWNPRLQADFKKCGEESFIVQALETSETYQAAKDAENAWIKAFPDVYNVTCTGWANPNVVASLRQPENRKRRGWNISVGRRVKLTSAEIALYKTALATGPMTSKRGDLSWLATARHYGLNIGKLANFVAGRRLEDLTEMGPQKVMQQSTKLKLVLNKPD